MDSFPDPRALSDADLVELIEELTHKDHDTEYLRGVAQRKIQVLRAEMIQRSDEAEDDLD